MLDYGQIAERLKAKRGSLQTRIWKHNLTAREEDKIKPDKIEAAGGVNRHLFTEASLARIQAALIPKKRGPKPAKEDK